MNEEDIKILEELIKQFKNNREIFYNINEEEIKALENLINRNKELEEEYYYEKNRARTELDTVYIKARYDERDKWKSKIKEKIEELNKLITEAQKELGSASKEYTIYVYQKDILEEILEEC